MAEHEHTRTIHLYHVELPYGLDGLAMEFEKAPYRAWQDSFMDMIGNYESDEVRRILTGTVALLAKYPHRGLSEALETAMVWERG